MKRILVALSRNLNGEKTSHRKAALAMNALNISSLLVIQYCENKHFSLDIALSEAGTRN